jgi:hypothetical protein
LLKLLLLALLKSLIFTFSQFIHPQGKVEEDRFMRAQDAAHLKKIHDAMLEQAKAAAEAHESVQFKDHIHPVMMEIKGMLASSDSLSDKSLETIAKWKLGL